MAELIYAVISYAMAPLVSIAFILIVFLASPKLPVFHRALLSSLIGSILTVGPGMYYNLSEGLESEANPAIYFALFWVPALIVSWVISWLFARRLVPPPSQEFE